MTSENSISTPLHGPLHTQHEALGAKFGEFGGWLMPLEYTGVKAEHRAVREAVGIFDVSHLGKATVSGEGARDFVNSCLTNDLGKITSGQAQYTLCCDESSGGVVDDLIVYVRSDDEVFLIPNASNTDTVIDRFRDVAPDTISITNQHQDFAVLAVQGPLSDDVLVDLGLPADHDYMTFVGVTWRGVPLVVCRTGYTGERGYELVVPRDDASFVWSEILKVIRGRGGLPCGLGARDTLRLEMGYPLHGQELTMNSTPLSGGAAWAVSWSKPQFWGKPELTRLKEAGTTPKLVGLIAQGRGVIRSRCAVFLDDTEVGSTTSGTMSPTLGVSIGLAHVDRAIDLGTRVEVDVRGRRIQCDVVRPPFVQTSVRSD